MLSDSTVRTIAELFCGDIQGFYSYKKGPQLIEFFNKNFQYDDHYGQGFPSRWAYTKDKLNELLENEEFETSLISF